LEFFYCDRLIDPVTGLQTKRISAMCVKLGLVNLATFFEQLYQYAKNTLREDLVKDLQSR